VSTVLVPYVLGRSREVDDSIVDELLAACAPADLYARFNGHVSHEAARPWLLPRVEGDLVLALVGACTVEVAGVVTVGNASIGEGELSLLVAPGWRRRGIGSQLARLAHQMAGRTLIGTIAADNTPAQRLLNSSFPSAQVTLVQDEITFAIPGPEPNRRLDLSPVFIALGQPRSRT